MDMDCHYNSLVQLSSVQQPLYVHDCSYKPSVVDAAWHQFVEEDTITLVIWCTMWHIYTEVQRCGNKKYL
jgi:hypothetical protein